MKNKNTVELAKELFENVISVTYKMYKLFTRMQEHGEIQEACPDILTSEAARSKLRTFEDELVRVLFISRMGDVTLQDTLTLQTLKR